jgi:hypothetical protein
MNLEISCYPAAFALRDARAMLQAARATRRASAVSKPN